MTVHALRVICTIAHTLAIMHRRKGSCKGFSVIFAHIMSFFLKIARFLTACLNIISQILGYWLQFTGGSFEIKALPICLWGGLYKTLKVNAQHGGRREA